LEENKYLTHNDISLTVGTDVGLHELIYKAARNEKLITITGNLKEQMLRLRSTSMSMPGRKKKSLEEHKEIVEAIGARNIELAQRLGQEHIERAEQVMIEFLGNKDNKEYQDN
jgi:DNA-binding FadR family transcriptional regulator